MKMKMDFLRKRGMVPTAMIAAIALIVIGLVSGDTGLLGNLIIIAIFLIAIPIFLGRYARFVWIKAVEDQFPNFVRDMADSIRSGMSVKEAIKLSSKGNYDRLTPEVKSMSSRLSWGTPVLSVLDIFGSKTRESKLIAESLNVMKESIKAGGDVSATFDAIARDLSQFKEIEAERSSMVRQHVMIMYGIFFMFLAIAIMIIFVMVPMIKSQPSGGVGGLGLAFQNPCEGIGYFPCDYFMALGILFTIPEGITLYYTSLLFTIVLIQGIFTGLIAGQLGENSIIAGTKHSLIMATVSLAVFLFIAKAGFLPI